MARPRVYSDELRERAVRLLWEWREARGVSEGGYTAISEQLGLQRETLRRWVIDAEVEQGTRPGLNRDERARLAELERRTGSCGGPTRSSRARRLSSGRSSTADRRSSRLRRLTPGPLRGRADLEDPRDRPIHLLLGQEPTSVPAAAQRREAAR